MASYVQRINGAIGYVETAYALQNHIAQAKLKNHSGQFVDATDDSVQAAARGADWPRARGFYMVLTNQPGSQAWPITGATFVLVRRKQKDTETGRAVLRFFDWGFRNGGAAAKELGYVPMPAAVVDLIEKAWEHEVTDASGQKIWPANKQAMR